MATQTQKSVTTNDGYCVECKIENKLLGAPIVNLKLEVNTTTSKVEGSVQITQAVRGGNFSGNVTGRIYSTGLGKCTKIVELSGKVSPDSPLIALIDFDAHLAIDDKWNGTGGFNYLTVHVENAFVTTSDR